MKKYSLYFKTSQQGAKTILIILSAYFNLPNSQQCFEFLIYNGKQLGSVRKILKIPNPVKNHTQ